MNLKQVGVTMPLFTIVTVCRNAATTIRAAGLSLLNQSIRDYEWLVIDGASTDRTLEVVESLKVQQVRIYSEPDQGIYDAMNKAVRLAQGDIVYFLNADDELHDSDVLAETALEFSAHPHLEFLFGNIVIRKEGQEIFKRQRYINRMTLPFEDLSHQAVFARRELFLRVGYFELDWPTSADYDWFLRVFASGANVKYVDRYIAYFMAGGAHSRDPKSLTEERRALRLQYMSLRSLAIGTWLSRAAHKLSTFFRRGFRIGQSSKR